jgi:hypothetical protein
MPYLRAHFEKCQKVLQSEITSGIWYSAFLTVLSVVMHAAQRKEVLSSLLADMADLIRKRCQDSKLNLMLTSELESPSLGLADEDIDFLLPLICTNPFRAGLEINIRKGSCSRNEKRLARMSESQRRKQAILERLRSEISE